MLKVSFNLCRYPPLGRLGFNKYILAAFVWVALILVSEVFTSINPKVIGNLELISSIDLLVSDSITSTTDK